MNNAFLGVALGLVLIFAILSSVVSALTEAVARFAGLRGEYLLRGLRSLLTKESTFSLPLLRSQGDRKGGETCQLLKDLLAHPMVEAQGNQGQPIPTEAGNGPLSRKERRRLPSYLSSRTFAHALVDTLVPDEAGKTDLDKIQDYVEGISDPWLKKALLSLVRKAEGDVTRFRQGLEDWYDEHMARVSGWYKRHVRWISLTVALALVLLSNLNAVRLSSALYLDEPLRAAVQAQAAKAAACSGVEDCVRKARDEVAPLEKAGLPIGWSPVPACAGKAPPCGWWSRYGLADANRNGAADLRHLLLALLGYAIMVVSTLPGARFWFDALSRLNSLRESGPKPTTAPVPSVTVVEQLLPPKAGGSVATATADAG